MSASLLYSYCAIALFVMGLYGAFTLTAALKRVLAINIMGNGVFMLFIATAHQPGGTPADPVPQALVLTGIVVAVSATALALKLICLVQQLSAGRDQ